MYGMGVAVGDYNNDGFPDLSSPASARTGCFGTRAKARSSTSRAAAAWRAPGIQHVGSVVRFRSRRTARPVRLQLRQVVAGARRVLQPRRQAEVVLHARSLPRRNLLAVSQPRRRHLRGRHRKERHLRHQLEIARRGDVRLRPGRLAGSVRRQRHAAEQAVSQPAERDVQGGRRRERVWRSARMARRAPAWAWTRPTSTIPATPSIAVTNFDNEMIGLYRAAERRALSGRSRTRVRRRRSLARHAGVRLLVLRRRPGRRAGSGRS